jgi:integrase
MQAKNPKVRTQTLSQKPKRRRRRKTPGVSLIRPQKGSRAGWRIQFRDPEDGDKLKRKTIPVEWAATEDLRIEFCVRKCDELDRERRRLAEGGNPNANKSAEEAVREWTATYPDLRTQETYAAALGHFLLWASEHKIESLDDVRQSTLKTFRDDLHTADRETTTLNKWLRASRTFFVWAIQKGYCPKLKEDDLVALKKWREKIEDPDPLDPPQVQAIFEAVERHDADVFLMTRDEKVGGRRRQRSATPKYDSLAPMIMLTALAGLRKNEAVQLTWKHYRKGALDASGNEVGQITVPATISKTKRERKIPLDHSPALRRYLNKRLMATGGEGTIAGISYDQASKALRRLREVYGAPPTFNWQAMRITASSYLTSAKNIFGASSHAQSASRLGHSWEVAQRHYAATIAGIAGDATTLEAALGIEEHVTRVCADGTWPAYTQASNGGAASPVP